jgi:hypothetical protein
MIFNAERTRNDLVESNPLAAVPWDGETPMRETVLKLPLLGAVPLCAALLLGSCSPIKFSTDHISLATVTADLRVPGETALEFTADDPKMSFADSYHVCQFNGTAGDNVQFVIEGPHTYVRLVLYDGERKELGRAIVRADRRNPTINLVPPRTGTYYLVVAGNRQLAKHLVVRTALEKRQAAP